MQARRYWRNNFMRMLITPGVCAIALFAWIVFAWAAGAQEQTESFRLSAPIACDLGRDCFVQNYVDHGGAEVRDYHCGSLSYRGHDGSDFRILDMRAQRAGVNALAVAEGRVTRARDGVADLGASGMEAARAQGQECGNGVVISHADGWQTQYCHLAQGSVAVKPGDRVTAGSPVGRVGLSGMTEFPHLHLTVRRHGRIVDPFAYGAEPGSCGDGVSLWAPHLRTALAYRDRVVLNSGFTSRTPVTMEAIESGEAGRAPRREDAQVLAAFVRAIGLRAGDVQRLRIESPDKRIIADHTAAPLDRDKAQAMLFVGVRKPASGWPSGSYAAHYSVSHNGGAVIEQSFTSKF